MQTILIRDSGAKDDALKNTTRQLMDLAAAAAWCAMNTREFF